MGTMLEGPVEALLGTVGPEASKSRPGCGGTQSGWNPVTENPAVGTTEVWEFYNTTGDAHPMHVHEVVFEVVNREGLVLDADGEVVEPIQLDGVVTPPEPWETGFKDTVTAYPGQVTRAGAVQHARSVRLALPHRGA
jgi:spore coat protein A, manganese oxidase